MPAVPRCRQVGVATISANMQRSGGSQQHPGARLDAELELRAASIEGGAAGESIGMGQSSMLTGLTLGLELRVDLLKTLRRGPLSWWRLEPACPGSAWCLGDAVACTAALRSQT